MDKVLKIRGNAIPYTEDLLPVGELAFYPDNPRIYSEFTDPEDQTQENIQAKLVETEDVKELRDQIDRDGQVNEPLLCVPIREDSEIYGKYKYQVLEGNRRLAALRMEKKGSLPATDVMCSILDFSKYNGRETESLIFQLLGQVHIIGKKNWETYERAAYIYRRFKNHGVPVEDIGKEIPGQTAAKIRQLIEAFEMMLAAGDKDTSNWSYYLAYVSGRRMGTKRKDIPNLDERVVSLIAQGKFHRALDLRDRLPDVLDSKSARAMFFDKDEDDPFREALTIADAKGDTNAALKRLKRFRKEVGTRETKTQIGKLLKTSATKGPTEYELKQIVKLANQLLERASR